MKKTEIAHRTRDRPDVKRIPRAYKDHAQPIELIVLDQERLSYRLPVQSFLSMV
jgi:hypothetical protein